MIKNVLIPESGGECGVSCIKIIKSRLKGMRVVAIDSNPYVASVTLADKFYLVPSSSDTSYFDVIKEIVKNEKIDIILPTFEHGIGVYKKLEKVCKFDFINSLITRDKLNFYKYCVENGISTVDTMLLNEVTKEWLAKYNDFYIKPRFGSGSKLNFTASNKKSVTYLKKYLTSNFSKDFIIQPLIKSKHWAVDVVAENGVYIRSSPRLDLYLNGSRCVAVKVCANKVIEKFVRDFQEKIKIQIPYNMELFEVDVNKFAILEVNLRFGGGVIFNFLSGFDPVCYFLTGNNKYLGSPKERSYTSYKYEKIIK